MKQVNIHEAKSTLSRLIQEVEAGEEVRIARAGKVVARLVRAEPSRPALVPGRFKGKIWMAPDLEEVDREIERLMNDGPIFPDEEPPT